MQPDTHRNPNCLPNDVEQCHALIEELTATLHEQQRQAARLQKQVEHLLKRLYGPRSERIDPGQLTLFGEQAQTAAPEQTAEEQAPAPKPAKGKGHGRKALPKDLPRKRIVHDAPAEDKKCPECGADKKRIGEEVSEQLEYVPASLYLLEHVRPKYACPCCEEHVAVGDKPAKVIAKGLPGPGLVSHIAISKYCDHCVPAEAVHVMRDWPLAVGVQAQAANRLERRWSRAGVVSVKEKARQDRVRCELERRAKANLTMKCRNSMDDVKTGEGGCSGMSIGVTCVLPMRRPALRRRESSSGACMEAGNLSPRCEGRSPSGGPTRMSVPMRGTGAESSVVATKVL